MDAGWIEHRRPDDRERVGWIEPRDDGFVAIDLFGRPITGVVDWLAAEEALEARGLGYLAEPYGLRQDDGTWTRVRIVEVTPQGVRVKEEDWSEITATLTYHSIPFPVDENRLRPWTS